MSAHGHVLVWGTHAGKGRASDANGWYQQLQAWWAARTAAREQARRAALQACWDAEREALRPQRAQTAPELAWVRYGLPL